MSVRKHQPFYGAVSYIIGGVSFRESPKLGRKGLHCR